MKWANSIDELLENLKDDDFDLVKEDDPEQIDKKNEEENQTPWLQGSKYERI